MRPASKCQRGLDSVGRCDMYTSFDVARPPDPVTLAAAAPIRRGGCGAEEPLSTYRAAGTICDILRPSLSGVSSHPLDGLAHALIVQVPRSTDFDDRRPGASVLHLNPGSPAISRRHLGGQCGSEAPCFNFSETSLFEQAGISLIPRYDGRPIVEVAVPSFVESPSFHH